MIIIKTSKHSDGYKDEECQFYELCKNKKIEKVLSMLKSESLNIDILVAGIVGAMCGKNEVIINELHHFCEKNQIMFHESRLEILLNCAITNENKNEIKYWYEKYDFINKKNNENLIYKVDEEGKIDFGFKMKIILKANEYFLKKLELEENVFRFAITNNKWPVINYFLSNTVENKNMIEDFFICSCIHKCVDILVELISNNEYENIIINSQRIKLFMQENTEYIDEKKQAKIIIEKNNLAKKINTNISEGAFEKYNKI